MEQPADVRLLLRLRAAHANGATIRASLNGAELSSCALPAGAWTECRIEAPVSATRSGLNDLRLTSDTVAPDRPGDPRELAFVMQDEVRTALYVVRLLAFILILVAIIDKNRGRQRQV